MSLCEFCGGPLPVKSGSTTLKGDEAFYEVRGEAPNLVKLNIRPAAVKIMRYLLSHEGRKCGAREIIDNCLDRSASKKAVQVHICLIRKAYRKLGVTFLNIETGPGGYLWKGN